MEKEKLNKQNKPGKERKEGYIIVPHYFLKKWVRVLGVGPFVLYQELLTYCHKEKYIAWPTINSLCQQMGIAKTTLLRYQNTLIKFGLIKNITRGKSTTGHYKNNIYQITSLEELSEHPDPGKIIDFVGSKMKPDRYQNDTCIGSNLKLSLVSKRYPNNTNLNITNTTTTTTTTKGGKDAVVVDFKKLKEKGEEKMQNPHNSKEHHKEQAPCNSKEHYTGQAIREQLRELDFKEEFIEKILKEYSMKKINEKLDLLMEKRNIQSPAGWLSAALKNDYHDPEQERYDEEPAEKSEGDKCRGTMHRALNESEQINPSLTKNKNSVEGDSCLSISKQRTQSREKALKMIRRTQKMLANLKTKGGTNVRAKRINH